MFTAGGFDVEENEGGGGGGYLPLTGSGSGTSGEGEGEDDDWEDFQQVSHPYLFFFPVYVLPRRPLFDCVLWLTSSVLQEGHWSMFYQHYTFQQSPFSSFFFPQYST
jgi:hypothetical protein